MPVDDLLPALYSGLSLFCSLFLTPSPPLPLGFSISVSPAQNLSLFHSLVAEHPRADINRLITAAVATGPGYGPAGPPGPGPGLSDGGGSGGYLHALAYREEVVWQDFDRPLTALSPLFDRSFQSRFPTQSAPVDHSTDLILCLTTF